MNINEIAYFQFIEDFQQLNGIYQVSKICDYTSILEDKINLFELYENLGIQDRYNKDIENFLITNEIFYTLINADDILNNSNVKRVYTIPKTIMGDFVPDTTNVSEYGDFIMLMELGTFEVNDIRIKPIIEHLKEKASAFFPYVVNTSLSTKNNKYGVIDASDESNDTIINSPDSQYDEITKLNNENIDLKEKLAAYENIILAIPNLEARKEVLSTEITADERLVNTQIETLKSDKLSLESEKSRLNTDIEELRVQKLSVEREKDAAENTRDNLLNQIENIQQTDNDDLNQLRISLATANSTIETLNQQILDKNAEINDKNTEIANLNNRITTLENQLAECNRLKASLEVQKINLNAKIESLELAEERLNQQIIGFQRQIADNTNEIARLNAQLIEERNRLLVDAGEAKTVEAQSTVTLDGSNSFVPTGVGRTYRWDSYGNEGLPPISIDQSDRESATFVAPQLSPGTSSIVYSFLLTISTIDDENSDIINITVKPPNSPPIANAGDNKSIAFNSIATLDGSESIDIDGNIKSYSWVRIDGTGDSNITLNNPNTANPTFLTDNIIAGAPSVTHEFELTVTDDDDATDKDKVIITVTPPLPPNRAPIANAGTSQLVKSGTTVTLDGSDSYDPDGDNNKLTYLWEREDTSDQVDVEPVLSDSRAQITTFTADPIDDPNDSIYHKYKLTVTDPNGDSSTDSVAITVTPNIGPIMNAGPDQTVRSGSTVTLAGSGSDPDGGSVTYAWERVGGTGGSITLSDTTISNPTFTADTLTVGATDVSHIFRLTVTDNENTSDTDIVIINVIPTNIAPTSDAGNDRVVPAGSKVTLDGSQSIDTDGCNLTYLWERIGGTGSSITLSATDKDVVTFDGDDLSLTDTPVTHEFRLTVTDGQGATATDIITITVSPLIKLPLIINAGPDQTVDLEIQTAPLTITLNGSGSSDPNGGNITYSWKRLDTINGAPVTLTNPTTATPSFVVEDLPAGVDDVIHIFQLTITDSNNISRSSSVNVIIKSANAAPIAGVDFNVINHTRTIGNTNVSPNITPNLYYFSGDTVTINTTNIDRSGNYPLTYQWSRIGGTGSSNILNGVTVNESTLSFTADTLADGADAVTHKFRLIVTDNLGKSDSTGVSKLDVEIVVKSNNIRSLITYNPAYSETRFHSFSSGTAITLRSSGSFFNGSHEWSRIGGNGNANILSGITTNGETLTFTADTLVAGSGFVTHIFQHKWTNSNINAIGTGIFEVTIFSDNLLPTAHAGYSKNVISGSTVYLDGSRSNDPDNYNNDNKRLAYTWSRTGGTGDSSTIDIKDATTSRPYFTVDRLLPGADPVTHIFELSVRDITGSQNTNTDTNTITITVNASDAIPVSNAGPDQDNIISGSTVTLDGLSGSTSDNIQSYSWRRIAGSKAPIPIFDTSLAQPTFKANNLKCSYEDVVHIFELTVTDNRDIVSEPNLVRITISAPKAPPIVTVDKLVQTVLSGDIVSLKGSAKNEDNSESIFSYQWRRTGGTGGSIPLINANTSISTFTSDTVSAGSDPVIHTFRLTARNENNLTSESKDVIVIINPEPVGPIVNVRDDREVISGENISITSSTRDPLGTGLTYLWTRVDGDGNENIILNNSTTATLTVTGDTLVAGAVSVTHRFRLTITDSQDRESHDDMILTVISPNIKPTANAGPDQTVVSGTTVMLDGSNSFDTGHNAHIVSYKWTRIGGTGHNIPPTFANKSIACFVADILDPGDESVTHTFRLTVTDDRGAQSNDDVILTVTAPSIPNRSPIANAGGDITAYTGDNITLDGTGSYDIDNNELTYLWSIKRLTGTGSLVTISNPTSIQPSLTIPNDVENSTYEITLSVSDILNLPVKDTITLTVEERTNIAPIAVISGDGVISSNYTRTKDETLGIGFSSINSRDANNNQIATRQWTTERVSGDLSYYVFPAQEHSGLTNTIIVGAGQPNNSTPLVLKIKLSVTDDGVPPLTSDEVEATITINGYMEDNEPPEVTILNKINREVVSGQSITISSTATDDGNIASYAWSRTGGSGRSNILTGVTKTNTYLRVTGDTLAVGASSVTHTFRLTVTDNDGLTDTDNITITVTAPIDNTAPVVTLPNSFIIDSGNPIIINGTATDDGTISSYTWTRISGTGNANILSGVTTTEAILRITADTISANNPRITKNHVFELAVVDNNGNIGRARITVTIRGPLLTNTAPDISFSQKNISVTYNSTGITIVNLNTQLINIDNDQLTYTWTLNHISGSNTMELDSTNTRNNTLISTSTKPTTNMIYEAIITARDSGGLSDSDTIRITIIVPLQPTAVITPNTIPILRNGDIFNVSGSNSTDPIDSNLSYSWSFTRLIGSTNYIQLLNSNRENAIISINTNAFNSVYRITLTVTNEYNLSSSAEILLTVQKRTPNMRPVAIAGEDVTVRHDGSVQLDGSNSYDPDGDPLTYRWVHQGLSRSVGPNTAMANRGTIQNPNTVNPTFISGRLTRGNQTTHALTLIVTDVYGRHSSSITDDSLILIRIYKTSTPDILNISFVNADANDTLYVTASPNNVIQIVATIIGEYSHPDWKRVSGTGFWSDTDERGARFIGPITERSVRFQPEKGFPKETTGEITHILHFRAVGKTTSDSYYITKQLKVVVRPNTTTNYAPVARITRISGSINNYNPSITYSAKNSYDANNDIESYEWTLTYVSGSRSNVSISNVGDPTNIIYNLSAENVEIVHQLTSSEEATYTLSLTVRDNGGRSHSVSSSFTLYGATSSSGSSGASGSSVEDARTLPSADAGEDIFVKSGRQVQLDGSGSSVLYGNISSYYWERISGTGSDQIVLSDPNIFNPTFIADTLTIYNRSVTHDFRLTVTDDNGNTNSDRITVTVI